jgi:hypothetical protein
MPDCLFRPFYLISASSVLGDGGESNSEKTQVMILYNIETEIDLKIQNGMMILLQRQQ